MARSNVPFTALLKSVLTIALPSLLVLGAFTVAGKLDITYFLLSFGLIFFGSMLLVYPFLSNVSALTHYVNDLAQDKRVEPPDLSFLGMVVELSTAVSRLQRVWEVKKQQMERIITEREILVDTLPDILIMINDDKEVIRTNRAARAIFGQNLAHRPLKDIIPTAPLLDSVTSVIEDLKGREVEFRIEEPVVRDFLAVIERFPIPSPGGISVVITMNDITELKAVEQMRADFVANASHEIRTPLATISGFIETLQGPARDDAKAREEFLKLMAEQADRMKRLISDLLSLSKIEMNAHSVPTDKVDLAKVIRSVARDLDTDALRKHMAVKLDLHPNLPPAKGDENELAQVIHNLMGNAIKYGVADSEIRVSARVTTDLPPDQHMRNLSRVIMVAVRDRSEGIAREHLTRLMERFYRVDTARSRAVGGTGLGLAIVKGIVHRHRGAITIDSLLGQGSTFTVYIPIFDEG